MSADDPGLELVEAAAVADAFGADAVRLGGGAVCAVAPRLEEVTINRVIGLGIEEAVSDEERRHQEILAALEGLRG